MMGQASEYQVCHGDGDAPDAQPLVGLAVVIGLVSRKILIEGSRQRKAGPMLHNPMLQDLMLHLLQIKFFNGSRLLPG